MVIVAVNGTPMLAAISAVREGGQRFGKKAPLASPKADFISDQEVRWCPGCGDYAIRNNVPSDARFGHSAEKIVFCFRPRLPRRVFPSTEYYASQHLGARRRGHDHSGNPISASGYYRDGEPCRLRTPSCLSRRNLDINYTVQ